MADSSTTNFGWTKPEVGASGTTWGNKLNANLDAQDTLIKNMKNVTDVAMTPVNVHAATSQPTPADTDEIVALNSASSFASMRITWANLKARIRDYLFATNKASVVDADVFAIADSAATFAPKYVQWAQLKASIKAYTDGFYSVLGHTHTFASLTGKPTTVSGYGITDVAFTKSFESAQQTIANGATRTIAHGLGVVPKFCEAVLQCVANDWGYVVGQEIKAPTSNVDTGNAGRNCVIAVDNTNIYVQYGNLGTNMFNAMQWSTGAQVLLTSANWRLVVRAFG